MNIIDNSVLSALNELDKDSDEKLKVLVTCSEKNSDKLAKELAREGGEVTQTMPELDMIFVKISHKQLALLQRSKHVYAVELDEDANTQGEDLDANGGID